jgi:ABC-type transport system involved in cytochrome c biogenesis ATPase subunit
MNELRELAGLLERLEGKLEYTRKLIAEYEETMDYASHCNLLGFAEGIEFALEEIGETLKEKKSKDQRKPSSRGVKKGTR